MPKHHPTRDLIRRRCRDDARKLAQMFNESHAGWPGGFGQAEHRAEDAQRDLDEGARLAAFVAEADGRIVAYCDLWPQPARPREAYVGLLNSHPKCQGKGFGKAVLLSAVERAFDLGFDQVALSTWAGNLKAVPLYKKSGFMWRPETRVDMENFTPLIRRMAPARAFFAKHDWYDTQQRDLSVEEDLFKRGKVRAYCYLWQAGDDMLRVVIDRQSWGPIEIETNDLRVACSLPDERLVAGLPHPVRWEVENKRGGSMEVTLIASGDTGISIDARRTLTVKRRARVAGEFVADPEMPEKEREPRAAIITTTFVIAGQAVELKAGFTPVQPVTVGTDPGAIWLRPRREERVTFTVTSNLAERATFRPKVQPVSEVKVEHAKSPVQLGPHGTASFEGRLSVPASGAVALKAGGRVTVGKRSVEIKAAEVMARALHGLECVGSVSKHHLVLESAALRVEQARRGGWLRVFDKARRETDPIECSPPQLGPPFVWEEFFIEQAEAQVEQSGDAAAGVVTSESATRPGVRLRRRIRLSPGRLVEIGDTIINGSPQRLAVRLVRRFHPTMPHWRARGADPQLRLAAPTASGVVTVPYAGVQPPAGDLDLRDEPESWPEGWAAAQEGDGSACGVVFAQASRVHLEWGLNFEVPLDTIEPGDSRSVPPFYIVTGQTGWLAVRRWWQALFGEERAELPEPAPREREGLEFGLEPSPVVIAQAERPVKAVVRAIGRSKHSGTLSLSPAPGLRLSARKVAFRDVSEDLSVGRALTLARGAREGVSEVGLALDTGEAVLRNSVPVIALGKPGGRTGVRQRGAEWLLDNGVVAARVAPEFCGSVVSLRVRGEEYLRSAHPEARPMASWNPWHGGIRPMFHALRGNLWEERFTARAVERTGAQGVLWKGVRVSCRPKHRSARHLGLQVEYLLAPGSAVMAVVGRVARLADTPAEAGCGFEVWPLLGGSALNAALSCQAHPDGFRRRTEWRGRMELGAWGMAENPRTHHALLLAAGGSATRLDALIIGKPGYVMGGHLQDRIPPHQAIQGVLYIVIGRDRDHVRTFAALAALQELP